MDTHISKQDILISSTMPVNTPDWCEHSLKLALELIYFHLPRDYYQLDHSTIFFVMFCCSCRAIKMLWFAINNKLLNN